MSTGFPFFDPRVKPLSSNGLPQAGCYYCFFITGTLTPANVYADNLVTPLSQPSPGSVNPPGGTVADSAGRFAVMYLDPSVTYRAQLYSAAGVLLEDTDPFKAPGSPSVAFSNGTAAAPGIAFTNYLNTGLYIPSANSLGFATNGLAAGSISQNQAWSLPAANGAATMTIAGASGFYAGVFNGNSTSANSFGLEVSAGTTAADVAMLIQNQAASATFLEIFGDGHGTLGPTSSVGLSWNTAGTFALAAPANVPGLQINGNATSGQSFGLKILAGTTSADLPLEVLNHAGTTDYLYVQGNGETFIQAPAAATAGTTGCFQAGYMEMPQNVQSGSYQLVMTDRGKALQMNAGSTVTIPANASVAFPIGTTILVNNLTGSSIALNITTDTLSWQQAGSVTSGNRTLAFGGVATLYKRAATTWAVWGLGLS